MRDEGGGSNLNLFTEVVTYKTIQVCQLRMTPATATLFSSLWMQLCAGQLSSEREYGGAYDLQAVRLHQHVC